MDLDRIAGVEPPIDPDLLTQQVRAWMDGDEDEPALDIADIGTANWCLQVIGEAKQRAQGYDDQIQLWTEAKRRVLGLAEWLELRLEEWAVANRTERTKSFPLAHGTIATRKGSPGIDVVDEPAAIAWAKINDVAEAVRTTEKLLTSLLEHVHYGKVVVGYEAIDRTTGEVERIDVEPTPPSDLVLQMMRDKLPHSNVSAIEVDAVVDDKGHPVPGLAYRTPTVGATVRPLGL